MGCAPRTVAVGRFTEAMSSEAKEHTFDEATAAAEELYLIRDTFFPVNPDDKTSKLQELSDLAVKILDSIPPGRFCFHFSLNLPIAISYYSTWDFGFLV